MYCIHIHVCNVTCQLSQTLSCSLCRDYRLYMCGFHCKVGVKLDLPRNCDSDDINVMCAGLGSKMSIDKITATEHTAQNNKHGYCYNNERSLFSLDLTLMHLT